MLEASRVCVSRHALERYVERVDKEGTRGDIRVGVRDGKLLGKKGLRKVRAACPAHQGAPGEHLYVYNSRTTVLFVLKIQGVGAYIVKTCWPWPPAVSTGG